MGYIISSIEGEVKLSIDGLAVFQSGEVSAYGKAFTEEEMRAAVGAYQKGELQQFLDNTKRNRFVLFLVDSRDHRILVCNDPFSSNEIFVYHGSSIFIASEDVATIFEAIDKKPEFNQVAAYEMLTFYTVCPPKTIYKDIQTIPMASIATYDIQEDTYQTERYWDIESLLPHKINDYDTVVSSTRDALYNSTKKGVTPNMGMSLSGGIDSGGLLGMLRKNLDQDVPAIAVGPYGPESADLQSARLTAQEHDTKLHEIYPEKNDLRKLPRYMKGLQQPKTAEYVFIYSAILEKARELSIDRLYNGSGAEMLLGNLRTAKIAYRIGWIDPYVPRFIYSLISRVQKYSHNQREFLLARSWTERFMRARGPMFAEEHRFYTKLPDTYWEDTATEIDKLIGGHTGKITDHILLTYLLTWVNYLQYRDFGTLTKKYDVDMYLPFDRRSVAEQMFQTPDTFRKLNRWSKQVIRDIFKPFVSDRLYKRKGKSLVLPYRKWFADDSERFIEYLRTCSLTNELIDLDHYEKEFDTLPDPGLSLVRLLGLATWHDANYDQDNLRNYEQLFKEKSA